MHWPSVLAAAALAGLATAHGGPGHVPGLPKILGGRRALSDLVNARQHQAAGAPAPRAPTAEQRRAADAHAVELERRQSGGKNGRCGAGVASCSAGYCCSAEGWCGIAEEYCTSPDCQINYGSGCDGNQRPSGADTSAIARPHLGKVQYGGVGIYDCANPGDIALTFDDGPYTYTGDLLDKFASYGAKATFFITGNNLGKGMINDASKPWAGYIKRMIKEGHQVASHTWSHENSSATTQQQWKNQMIWNEIAFNDILGFFPTYMRPPYSICEKQCQSTLSTLGYHIVYFDLDTEGYLHDDSRQIQTSKDIWDDTIATSKPARDSFLQIEHDIHWQTVYNLTDYFLTSLFARGYRSVTVGECLGDPPENWYRAGTGALPGGSTTEAAPPTTPKSSTAATTPKTTAPSTTIGKPTTSSAGPGPSPPLSSTTIRPPGGTKTSSSAPATAPATTPTPIRPTTTRGPTTSRPITRTTSRTTRPGITLSFTAAVGLA